MLINPCRESRMAVVMRKAGADYPLEESSVLWRGVVAAHADVAVVPLPHVEHLGLERVLIAFELQDPRRLVAHAAFGKVADVSQHLHPSPPLGVLLGSRP